MLARKARDLFPLTKLGVIVATLGALAAWAGIGEVDLVLLGAAVIALTTITLSIASVALGTLRVRRALRRMPVEGTPIAIECGFPSRTGFRLPRMRLVPGVRIGWQWSAPAADVRMLDAGGAIEEEVVAHARGYRESLRRRFEIADAFGIASILIEHEEARPVRMLPSVGGLKQMNVVRTLSGGSDITHPAGTPDGDRLDLRQYAPGDPIRFVLWSVFARSRQLVVRTPEKALSAARKTLAYLVTGPADEPAAGAARVALDVGALGKDWAFGADGVRDTASTKDAAIEALARSASSDGAPIGADGLVTFMKRASDAGGQRAMVFVPARPGPWLDRVVQAAAALPRDATGRMPLEFLICTDGADAPKKRSRLARIVLEDATRSDDGAVGQEELQEVVRALGRLRAKIVVVDRRSGHVRQALG